MESLSVAIEKSYAGGPDSAPFDLAVGFETSDELTVLFGPSGAGKTLTLDCIAGFIAPDRGRVRFGAETLFDSEARVNWAARKRRIGYVFQKDALFPHMTLRGNLEFAARTEESNAETGTIQETLERFGLASLAGRRPHQVSGGERQRCSIARILVSRPRLILLDEPARGLDVSLREQLYGVLAQVRAQDRLPMILVTHDLEEAFALGDRMLVYDRGRIIQDGPPAEIHARPASPAVARLLGIAPIFEGVAAGESAGPVAIEARGLRFPIPELNGRIAGDGVVFCIRTERVIARPAADGESSGGLTLPLQRTTETPTHVRLEFPGGVAAELPRQQAAAGCRATVGERWHIEFPPGSIWVFPREGSAPERPPESAA